MTLACPHKRIEFCPLYVAAHEADGFGCIRAGAGFECAVAEGALDYDLALGRLRAHAPRLVAEVEWNEKLTESREQRERNMKAAGLH